MAVATSAAETEILTMPTHVVDDITRKMQEKSVIMALTASTPKLFQDEKHIIFTEEPEAEYVGEGEAKNSSTFKFEPVNAKPHKVQCTVRMTEEVQWADEDGQLKILDALTDSLSGAAGRALDYGMIHGISPLQRVVVDGLKSEALALKANQVTSTGDYIADIDNIADAVLENYDVNGIALDRMFTNSLRKLRHESTGLRVYPDLNLTLDPGNLEGLKAVSSGAVSGKRLAQAPTGVLAIVGNWDLIKWGMVRDFSVEVIRYGDPDGLGDLRRFNQIAYRVESVFSWAVLDYSGFSVLKAATSDTGPGNNIDGEVG